MEDGDNSEHRGSEERKSMLTNLSEGAKKIKKVMNLVQPVLTSESLNMKVNRLKRKLDILKGKEDDINTELNYAESLSLKSRKKEVESWLKNVARIKVEVYRTEQEVGERKGKWIPNWQLPGNLDSLTAEVEELSRQGDFSGGLTLEAPESRGVAFPTTKLVGQMFQQNKNMILESLRDDNVLRIGIFGMGGVGKTALLTHINNEVVQNFPDTSVSWVTVSQKFTIHKLQDDIASALRFPLFEEDMKKRAAELSDFLRRRKNLVLILDDVWEDINLDEVGVRLYVNGCKLILTTRSLDVCRKMDCQKQIRIVPLCGEESWELFKNKLGDDMELTPEIEEVAKSLVKECAGLPLGIITMARSMKGIDDMFEWKNALENMRESKLEHDDMETKVFQVLKYSYDMLKDVKVQQCFLDCSLYPEDFKVEREDLVNQFIDEGLIDGMRTRQAEFYRGHTILNKLVNACLLENIESGNRRHVKMHDLVRDMALQITSDSPQFLVEAGKGIESIPDDKYWKEDLAKVSLMYNRISDIPLSFGSPKCPKLSTLLLNENRILRSISNDWFFHMKALNVLNLSATSIENLPDSIFELVNLSALLLIACFELKFVPSLAKLTALKKLDLYRSAVTEVPHGVENLLDLQFYHCSGAEANIEGTEFERLRKLERLFCVFRSVDSFNTYVRRSLHERGPTCYRLRLGSVVQNLDWYPGFSNSEKTLVWSCFDIGKSYTAGGGFPVLLPRCLEHLDIKSSAIEVSCLCDVISFANATNLKSCSITYCRGIEHLFSNSSSCTNPLQRIQKLNLLEVNGLCGLISWKQGQSSTFPHVTFFSLKELDIVDCDSITSLFVNASLPNLEKLGVMNCHSLVEIISTQSNNEEEDNQNEEWGAENIAVLLTLPKLSEISLRYLSSLQSISAVSDSLQKIEIQFCPKLKRIPLLDREPCPTSLQYVGIDPMSWMSLEWVHRSAKDEIHRLRLLTFLEMVRI